MAKKDLYRFDVSGRLGENVQWLCDEIGLDDGRELLAHIVSSYKLNGYCCIGLDLVSLGSKLPTVQSLSEESTAKKQPSPEVEPPKLQRSFSVSEEIGEEEDIPL